MLEALSAWLARPETTRALAIALLVLARVAPLALLAPWLGLRSAPATLRSGLVVVLAIALAPLAFASCRALPSGALYPLALLREALLGAAFALLTAVPFLALESGGRLVDLYRGANLAEVIAPPTGERTSPLGDLAMLGGLALFASLGGLRLAIGAFASGLVSLPVGALPQTGMQAIALDAAHALTSSLTFAAAFAAPAAVAIVVAEVALGLLARAVPRISVFFLGMPLRASLGLLLAFASIGLALRATVGSTPAAIEHAGRLLR